MAFDFPASPTEGSVYTPAGGPSYAYTNGVWRVMPPQQGVFISDTPPTPAAVGNMWWESDTGSLNIYYNDGNTVQWVQTNAMGIPEAPVDSKTWARKNQGWIEGYSKADADAAHVLKAGDRMPGALIVNNADMPTPPYPNSVTTNTLGHVNQVFNGYINQAGSQFKAWTTGYVGQPAFNAAGGIFSWNMTAGSVTAGADAAMVQKMTLGPTGILNAFGGLQQNGVPVAPLPANAAGVGQVVIIPTTALGNGWGVPAGGSWLVINFYWTSSQLWAGGPNIQVLAGGTGMAGSPSQYQTAVCWRIA